MTNRKKMLYWTDYMYISHLQRCVLVNSFLYYELDRPAMSDMNFDILCRTLAKEMKKKSREEIKEHTAYGYCMYDFDGSTGFDLWEKLTENDKEKIRFIAKGAI